MKPARRIGLLTLILLAVLAGRAVASSDRYDRAVHALSGRELHARRSTPAHIVAFFGRHRWLVAPRHATCWSVPWSRSCDRARLARRAARLELAAIDRRLAVLAAAAARARAASAWPAHHLLWICLSRHEGSPTSVNPNGHYGMLQMHAGWGYGTSYHASDDPQIVQEQAAERAYAASGYSSGFLYGQWIDYDGATECLAYA